MDKDDIIKLAREAGFADSEGVVHPAYQLEAFANLVAKHEREACAKLCDDKHDTWRWDDEADSASGPRDCAAAIRARGCDD